PSAALRNWTASPSCIPPPTCHDSQAHTCRTCALSSLGMPTERGPRRGDDLARRAVRMAALPHWLGEPPAQRAPLAGWALARRAWAVAEEVRLDAVVDVTSTARAVEADLGGPFGARAAGSPATGRPGEAQPFRLTDVSTRGLREEDAS